MWVGGEWTEAIAGKTRYISNPFNGQTIAVVAEGDERDARAAIQAARRAFDKGSWAEQNGNQRGKILAAVARLIERDIEKLAELETLDTGKTLTESRQDMKDIADVFYYYAGLADKEKGEVIDTPISDSTSQIVREPVGVAALITPWNYPLLQAAWKIAPALAAGNSIIMKPSEITPLTTIKMAQLLEEAGLPQGVANLVLGPGATVGNELAENENVDMISFTGGIQTGKKIMRAASRNVKKIALELGGKNPNIVFADCDFSVAVDQALNAAFFHAGQVCSAGARLLIEETIAEPFVEKIVERAKKIKLGNGLCPETESGPLISEEQRDKVEQFVKRAVQDGAVLKCGGSRPDHPDLKNGYFYLPTVLTDCHSNMEIVQNEVFGPVLTVETFRTEEEAIEKANNTIYGLAGALWSNDAARCQRVAGKLRLGTVWINDFHPYFAQAPWGGYKQSGIGRELGRAGFEEYTETKHIFHNLRPEALHWFGNGEKKSITQKN